MYRSTIKPLSEPHFDDERTLLSAKPVVPLDKVRVEYRKRRWLMTATITVAVVLGTLGASFIYFRSTTAAGVMPVLNQAQAGATGAFVGDEVVAESADESGSEVLEPESAQVQSSKRAQKKSQPVNSEQAEEVDDDSEEVSADDETVSSRPVSRRVARWEERRERRAARRDRASGPNDLFRIDQIFEGTPQP